MKKVRALFLSDGGMIGHYPLSLLISYHIMYHYSENTAKGERENGKKYGKDHQGRTDGKVQSV